MTIKDLINTIELDFPINCALSYDNSGANIVNFNANVNNILVCLDITIDTILYAKDNNVNLIISHHPLIFNEIKSINDDTISKKIKLLNKYDINAYSCHTNYDVNIENGMGYNLINAIFDKNEIAEKYLLEIFIIDNRKYGIGDIVLFKNEKKFDDLLSLVKNKLSLDDTKISYYQFNDNIKKIVVIPGSGSGDIDLVIQNKPDLLITSDLKHNNIIDLRDENISYINATHYGLEKIFIEAFSNYLKNKFKNLNILKYTLDL